MRGLTPFNGTGAGGWQLHHQLDFIHELNGWNILGERLGGSSGSFIRTYTWGTDLSGGLSGAGGVGGLLFTQFRTSNVTVANGMDLNGNVTLLVNTATGQSAATYEYGPFGEPLRQSGEYAMLNPYRFSTKYTDDESGLLDYGYRYYIPSLGRWPSRDPIEERGGANLYGFVGNDGVNRRDMLGLTGIGEILHYFFAPLGIEKTWVMETSDDYTEIVKKWGPVDDEVNSIMKEIATNSTTWKNNHMVTKGWSPGPNETPDPKSGYNSDISNPPGTDPETAKKEFLKFILLGIESDTLHTSSIGSFRMHATVKKIDPNCRTATADIWMSNTMNQASFGQFANHWAFSLSAMRPQHMWWHWEQEFSFDAQGAVTKGGGSGGGW